MINHRFIRRTTAFATIVAMLASGCTTLVSYAPQRNANDPAQSVKYAQGVGTVTVKSDVNEIFMYPAFKSQGYTDPTFVVGYANNGNTAEDFSTTNVKAFFRGVPVPIYTYIERVAKIQSDKRGEQIGLAILGGLAAGAAGYSASHKTYTSNYSGSVWGSRGGYAGFAGSNTVRVYDPMAGILVGGAIAAGTAYGITQIEYNAQNAELAANAILQENTVEPQKMVTGSIILRDCCDQFSKPGDTIRFEVMANGKTSAFEFARNVVAK